MANRNSLSLSLLFSFSISPDVSSGSFFLRARSDQLTHVLATTVCPTGKYNYVVSKRYERSFSLFLSFSFFCSLLFFESVPTPETRFASLSHFPRRFLFAAALASREQVEIKTRAAGRSPFGSAVRRMERKRRCDSKSEDKCGEESSACERTRL